MTPPGTSASGPDFLVSIPKLFLHCALKQVPRMPGCSLLGLGLLSFEKIQLAAKNDARWKASFCSLPCTIMAGIQWFPC